MQFPPHWRSAGEMEPERPQIPFVTPIPNPAATTSARAAAVRNSRNAVALDFPTTAEATWHPPLLGASQIPTSVRAQRSSSGHIGKSRPQRPLPVRQRQEIQEALRDLNGRLSIGTRRLNSPHWHAERDLTGWPTLGCIAGLVHNHYPSSGHAAAGFNR